MQSFRYEQKVYAFAHAAVIDLDIHSSQSFQSYRSKQAGTSISATDTVVEASQTANQAVTLCFQPVELLSILPDKSHLSRILSIEV
jgi:hypothetical protein